VVLRDAPHRPWCCDAEIDTPSHSDILTHIYPEYMTVCNCDGEDCPKNQTFLSMPDPTNAATWQFLSTVLGEVASLFPDEAFHIGGDEWWPAWATAPTVQKFMQAMNYSDAVDVYHYYERGIIDIVRGLGKTTVCAWEDIDGEPRSAAPLPSTKTRTIPTQTTRTSSWTCGAAGSAVTARGPTPSRTTPA
jgi:hexosaminidase